MSLPNTTVLSKFLHVHIGRVTTRARRLKRPCRSRLKGTNVKLLTTMNNFSWNRISQSRTTMTFAALTGFLTLPKNVAAEDCRIPLSELSPVPPIRIFRPNANMEIAFDVRTRTPVYVLQRLTSSHGQGKRRRRNFHEEKSLPKHYRSRNSHYHNSGYDRGHLLPAADFHNDPLALEDDSYNLINVAPQQPDMNRKIWAALEQWTRTIASQNDRSETYVVTGPLWLPARQVGPKRFEYNYPGLGVPPSLVAVPTHFFKIVVVLEQAHSATAAQCRIRKFACFVIQNDDTAIDRCLHDYLVPWTDLEAVSGLEFFPCASKEWKETADGLTNQLLTSSSHNGQLLLKDPRSAVSKRLVFDSGLEHLCQDKSCFIPHKTARKKQQF
jgi:endonuclease G, mitochondrial